MILKEVALNPQMSTSKQIGYSESRGTDTEVLQESESGSF